MFILTQFLLRLSFGLALGMAVTSPRQVTSGYYRNHLYVLLGLNVLASAVAFSAPTQFPVWPPLAAAILSYVGAVCWLYEKPRPGIAVLASIAVVTLVGAILAGRSLFTLTSPVEQALWLLDPLTGGLVLGVTIAAMFLGHWYLNSPTMKLGPLQRLVVLMIAVLVLRVLVVGTGLALLLAHSDWMSSDRVMLLALRWSAGLAGPLGLCFMTRATLKIPNTQSATGILYVAVIGTFIGELASLLLSVGSAYPL